MVKEWPQKTDHRTPIVKISDPAMEWHEVNLNDMLACCRRELAVRQRVYPKWVAKGTMSEKKAQAEIELMRLVVEFLTHCLFKAITRRAPEVTKLGDAWSGTAMLGVAAWHGAARQGMVQRGKNRAEPLNARTRANDQT